MTIKKAIRSAQILFPWLVEIKYLFQRFYRILLGIPFEDEFKILKYIFFDDGMCCIDVGCNRGQSIDAMRLYKKSIDIIAFEPNIELYERLKIRFKDEKNLKLYNFGLSNSAGSFKLYLPIYKGWMFDGLASFNKKNAESWLGPDTIYFFKEEDLRIREIDCSVRILDEIQCSPGFIKIDVQGLEKMVIKGAAKTIEQHRPVLLIETEDCQSDIVNALPAGYYPCEYVAGNLYVGRFGRQNTIFMTDKHLADYQGKSFNAR